jgi:hypothetical protein
MAGSKRWINWRGLAIYWYAQYFIQEDRHFVMSSRKSEGYHCQYPDSLAKPEWLESDGCKEELDEAEAEWYIKQSQQQCHPQRIMENYGEIASANSKTEVQPMAEPIVSSDRDKHIGSMEQATQKLAEMAAAIKKEQATRG